MNNKNISHLALVEAGFHLCSRKGVYLVNIDQEISPAFIPSIIRSKGKIRFSGGMGIYFNEFEIGWRNTLSRAEKSADNTLPLLISIENFLELSKFGVFILSDIEECIFNNAKIIFGHCSLLPGSFDELRSSIKNCLLLNKRIEQYIHYYSEIDENNIYFSKSASFFLWINNKYPHIGSELLSCVDKNTRILISRFGRNI